MSENKYIHLLTLEDQRNKYDIYLKGIEESNVKPVVTSWVLRYDYENKLDGGYSRTTNHRLFDSFENFVNRLLMNGFKITKGDDEIKELIQNELEESGYMYTLGMLKGMYKAGAINAVEWSTLAIYLDELEMEILG